MKDKIRVMLVDDVPMMRRAIEAELNRCDGLQCVGTYPTFEDAEKVFARLNPDVVLMDITLPGGMDGIAALRLIKKKLPRLKVVIFTMHDDEDKIMSAIFAGAEGYVLKSEPRERIANAIMRVHEGESALSSRPVDVLRRKVSWLGDLIEPLSPMEAKILADRGRGLSVKEIAAQYKMSDHTVREHLRRVFNKTGASSSAAAFALSKAKL